MKKKTAGILFVILLLLGVGMIAYPSVSSYVNTSHSSQAIQELTDQIRQADTETLELQRNLAQWYNLNLISAQPEEGYTGAYDSILSFANHMMGYIEIPGIDVYLPIYHGVSDEVLAKGVGHLPQSAFPVGGTGNHTALVGHTGLPSAKLFSDLTELTAGDAFYIHILGETLMYQVEEIEVVLPEEIDGLDPEPGRDLCTLITCTPYGVNSHRLLVRGVRAEKKQEENAIEVMADPEPERNGWTIPALAAALGVALIAVLLLIRRKKQKGAGA